MNLIDFFDRSVRNTPERTALVFGDENWSYRSVDDLVGRVARGLKGLEVGRDVKCAAISRNHPNMILAMLGVLRSGGVWVPFNTANSIEQNAQLIEYFDVEILFYEKEFLEFVEFLSEKCGSIRQYICLDAKTEIGLEFYSWAVGHAKMTSLLSWEPDAVCMLRSTGGTTGRPKGVMNTNRNFEATIANFLARSNFQKPPIYLANIPLTHAAAVLTMITFACGGTVVVALGFDPQQTVHEIVDKKVTFMCLPPTALYSLMAFKNIESYDLSSLEMLFFGAAPIAAERLREAIELFGDVLAQGYGQTETPNSVTFMASDEFKDERGVIIEERLKSCGRASPFCRVELMDDDGNILPVGSTGEIVVRGGLVMKGYYNDPEATQEVSAFGWHHTGDIAYQDEDGYFYICDRKKEVIITGGFNVYPAEVEQAILCDSAVLDCAVFGVPDRKWGEMVVAAVELKNDKEVSTESLMELSKKKLGSVKAPKKIVIVDRLPRSSVGKVVRRTARDQLMDVV